MSKRKNGAAETVAMYQDASRIAPTAPPPPPQPKRIILSLKNSHSVWFSHETDEATGAMFEILKTRLEHDSTLEWVTHGTAIVRVSEIAAVTLG